MSKFLRFELLPSNGMDYVMKTTKNTMEDPPERLTSKGAFVDVVKDDRACSCWLLWFSIYWILKCC